VLSDVFAFLHLEDEDVQRKRRAHIANILDEGLEEKLLLSSMRAGDVHDPEADPNHDAFRSMQLLEPLTARHREKWRAEMTQEQLSMFMSTEGTREMLLRYGYEST